MTQQTTATRMRGRPREFDPEQAVDDALDVFWSNGYRGTSLPDLIDATKICRASLYAEFGDKHGLFLRALDRYIDRSLARLDDELDPARPAMDGIRRSLDALLDRTTGAGGRRGCLVVATAMEVAGNDGVVRRRIRRFFAKVEARLTAAFERARIDDTLATGIDPAAAARVLLALIEGIRVVAKTDIDRTDWHAAVHALLDRFAR